MRITLLKQCILIVGTLISAASCKKEQQPATNTNFQFSLNTTEGWISDFADYPVGEEELFELESAIAALPSPLNATDKGMMIKGNNHSDDLFMFIKRKLTGLQPNKTYNFRFDINIASNAPSNVAGIGGAPGESVYLGIGATHIEPIKIINAEGINKYRMNIDKISQANNGNDMIVIGNIANGTNQAVYTLINRKGDFTATTNSDGAIWIIIGTDSGHEGLTKIYYDAITIQAIPVS